MSRLPFALVAGLLLADSAAALCPKRFVPRPGPVDYPLTPDVWGAPAPAFIPPPPPPPRATPKPAVREDDDPAPPPAPKKTDSPAPPEKPKEDAPKIPKPKVLIPGEPPPAKLSAEPVEPDDGAKPFNQYLVPADAPKAEPSAQVKVGFFNHSARDLVLSVHGEDVKLPGGQFVTLRLPRSFEWGEKGKKAATVTVPNDADGVEIVFRK